MAQYDRKIVLHVGSITLESKPFTERGLNLVNVVLEESATWFNNARAIVIAEHAQRMGFLRTCIDALKSSAEDYGLAFVIIAESNNHFLQIQKYWKELAIRGEPRIYRPEDLGNAAEYIIRNDPGPPLGDPKIETSRFTLSPKVRHMLQRAFYDCGKIHLEKLTGGKNSLNVYSVEAWLRLTEVGPRPLPFFIKIATHKEIEHELSNYHRYAEFYIPFHLRPNIVKERCVTICDYSAIVGNLVDEAMPLRQSLRAGHGAGALFTLFETSLKGFRFQPSLYQQVVRDMSLSEFVKGRIRADEIALPVVHRAQEFGLSLNPIDLQNDLVQRSGKLRCLVGPYHGDLHSGNVLIRGRDAILIDFSSASDGPLTADPAALEVSLMFGTDKDDKAKAFASWREFIDEVYGTTELKLRAPALHESKAGPFSWLRRPLRELRHISLACEATPMELKIVLAAYLMRFARLGVEFLPTIGLEKLAFDRHAYALVIAERVVKGLSDSA